MTQEFEARPISEVPEHHNRGRPPSSVTLAIRGLTPGSALFFPLNGRTLRARQSLLSYRVSLANRRDGGDRHTRYDYDEQGVWVYWLAETA
jgi:hypothetical protein